MESAGKIKKDQGSPTRIKEAGDFQDEKNETRRGKPQEVSSFHGGQSFSNDKGGSCIENDSDESLTGHIIVPLKELPTIWRVDVAPFAFAYSVIIAVALHKFFLQEADDQEHSLTMQTNETVLVTDDSHDTLSLNATTNLLNATDANNNTSSGFSLPSPTTLIFGAVLLSHLALWLAQTWKVSMRAWVGYERAAINLKSTWTHCFVTSPNRSGGARHAAIVPVTHEALTGVASIDYHNTTFRAGVDPEMDVLWNIAPAPAAGGGGGGGGSGGGSSTANDAAPPVLSKTSPQDTTFHRLHYPVDMALSFYQSWRGHATLKSILTATRIYGPNETEISLPPFQDLLLEQLVAPFFLFQLLCVVLWSLDEYWYYALFTLFALLLFECTSAFQRLKILERLRETLRHPYHVWVFRFHQWIAVSTSELVPGDIVSLTAPDASAGLAINKPNGSTDDAAAGAGEYHVPGDVLLLHGRAVVDEAMLTGESVPQLKNPLEFNVGNATAKEELLDHLDIEDTSHKASILFGGTVIVNHMNNSSANNNDTEDKGPITKKESSTIPNAPDGGVVCLVLRTGFETAQGALLRTMAHTAIKADGVNTRDNFIFVSILLLCAIASAGTVMYYGWEDDSRDKFKLILHVITIITSVVPPELPMELSLAVTNSVANLMNRCKVFCTEPYRIPWAGRVDVCCFDKTGTLTSDEMRLRGVRLPNADGNQILCSNGTTTGTNDDLVQSFKKEENEANIPWEVMRVMVACHSLTSTSSSTHRRQQHRNKKGLKIIGDPLEKAVLSETNYTLYSNDTMTPGPGGESNPIVSIRHRFVFLSRLKRMTVLCTETGEAASAGKMWALTKGAPETIKDRLTAASIPKNYDDVSRYHMKMGQRVLAMAYRNLGIQLTVDDWKKRGRDQVERDLIFAGFLVLDCPLKPDSKSVIKELRTNGLDVVMITGDASLTAAEVARQVGIASSKDAPTYELTETTNGSTNGEENSKFVFVPSNRSSDKDIPFVRSNYQKLKQMSKDAMFCATGDVMEKVALSAINFDDTGRKDSKGKKSDLYHPSAQAVLKELVLIVNVFARHAPRHKEAIVTAFNGAGKHTLMCGDGTNDVGALKRAHVGISIISAPELEAKQRSAKEKLAKLKKAEKKEKRSLRKSKGSQLSWAQHQTRAQVLDEAFKQLAEAEDGAHQVALGDASVASPFTSRALSIQCCKDVLKQGRCTLVTLLQIYKILGINSLVNALVLSTLYMHGAKQGDQQLTVLGFAIAALFFFVTKGKPLDTLSPHRPPSTVLCSQAFLSIALQFCIHAGFILAAAHLALTHSDPNDPSIVPDSSFSPNILNTCTFIMTSIATINTFVVNYRGRPFMEDFHENDIFLRSIQVCYAVLFICATEIFLPLNQLLELSELPTKEEIATVREATGKEGFGFLPLLVDVSGFQGTLCLFMGLDSLLTYGVEKATVRLLETKN